MKWLMILTLISCKKTNDPNNRQIGNLEISKSNLPSPQDLSLLTYPNGLLNNQINILQVNSDSSLYLERPLSLNLWDFLIPKSYFEHFSVNSDQFPSPPIFQVIKIIDDKYFLKLISRINFSLDYSKEKSFIKVFYPSFSEVHELNLYGDDQHPPYLALFTKENFDPIIKLSFQSNQNIIVIGISFKNLNLNLEANCLETNCTTTYLQYSQAREIFNNQKISNLKNLKNGISFWSKVTNLFNKEIL